MRVLEEARTSPLLARHEPRVLVSLGAAAAAVDLGVRSGIDGVTGLLAVVVAAVGLGTAAPLTNRHARVLVGLAVVFGSFLVLRTSPWLIVPDLAVTAALLVLAAIFARDGDVTDTTAAAVVARGVLALVNGVVAPADLLSTDRGLAAGRDHPPAWHAVTRGLALAAPLFVVLAVLLSSADAVFAHLVRISLDPVNLLAHIALLAVGGWGMAGLVRTSRSGPPARVTAAPVRLGRVEATVVLATLVGLFGAFAIAQLVALSASGRHVITTAGLTYAEYARTGYVQLMAVSAITLAVLLTVRAATGDSSRAGAGGGATFVAPSLAAVALTLVIVGVALHRLGLYEHAYGFTMLRVMARAFALWLGAAFVILAASLAGVGPGRRWLTSAAVAAGLVALLGLNLVNPEAVVARHNVHRAVRFDAGYLSTLSDDAVPALVAALPRLDPTRREAVRAAVCSSAPGPRFHGWASANRARHDADAARRRVCPERTTP